MIGALKYVFIANESSSDDKDSGEESVESLKAQLKAEKRKNKDLVTTVDILKKALIWKDSYRCGNLK